MVSREPSGEALAAAADCQPGMAGIKLGLADGDSVWLCGGHDGPASEHEGSLVSWLSGEAHTDKADVNLGRSGFTIATRQVKTVWATLQRSVLPAQLDAVEVRPNPQPYPKTLILRPEPEAPNPKQGAARARGGGREGKPQSPKSKPQPPVRLVFPTHQSGVSTPSRDSQSDFTQVTSTYDQVSTLGPEPTRSRNTGGSVGAGRAAPGSVQGRAPGCCRQLHRGRLAGLLLLSCSPPCHSVMRKANAPEIPPRDIWQCPCKIRRGLLGKSTFLKSSIRFGFPPMRCRFLSLKWPGFGGCFICGSKTMKKRPTQLCNVQQI